VLISKWFLKNKKNIIYMYFNIKNYLKSTSNHTASQAWPLCQGYLQCATVCLERKWEEGKHRLKEIICLERRREKVKEKKIGRDSPSWPSILNLSNLGSLKENQLKITTVCLKYIIFMLDMGVKWSFCSSNFLLP